MDLTQKKNSLRGYKAALTRKITAASDLLTNSENKALNAVRGSFEDLINKINAAIESYEAALQKVIEISPSAEISALETEANKLIENANKGKKELVDRLDELFKTSAPAASTSEAIQDQDRSNRVHRVNEALKPHSLGIGHNMLQFKAWLKMFRSYHKSSIMDTLDIGVQQQYLYALLQPDILCQVTPLVSESTPIFGDGGIISILSNIFKEHYPLFNRRLDLFKSRQQSGQDTLAWIANVRSLAAEANIDNITEDDIIALVLMVGIQDKETRKAWFKEQSPTLAKLINLAKNESIAVQMQKGQNGNSTVLVNAVSSKQAVPTKKKKKTKNCYFCGSQNHTKKAECDVFKKKIQCKNCQKLGHLAKVCKGTKVGAGAPTPPTKS